MTLYALLEPVLVGLIVLSCTLATLRHLMPRKLRRLASMSGLPGRLGQFIAPPTRANCATGCGSCAGCATPAAQPQPIIVVPRHKPAAKKC